MATTTPLGFQIPDGTDLVNTGDNVIAANGAKAEELHQDARGRLTVIEAKNATQDTDIAAARTNAVADAKTYADTQDAAYRTEDRALWRAEDDGHQTAAVAAAKTYTDAEDAKDRVRLANAESRITDTAPLLGIIPLSYRRNLFPVTATGPDASTQGLWHIDSSLSDASINGYTLTQVAGTPSGSYSADRRFGTRALGSGVYSHPSADNFLTATGADGGALATGTVECWVKSARHTGTKVAIGHNGWYWLGIHANGYAYAQYGNSKSTPKYLHGTTIIASTEAPTWNHIALVFRAGDAELYVNGVLEVTGTAHASTLADSSVGDFTIGGLDISRAFDFTLTLGLIDEVRISNTARYSALTDYPPRPTGLPGGYARYIGPSQPTTWLPGDEWTKTV